MSGGIRWGKVKNEMRKALKLIQAGDPATAAMILEKEIGEIEEVLNEAMKTRQERIMRQRRERLFAKIKQKKIDTASDS